MLTISLLGRPSIERDGQLVNGPRGQKTWALLGYLLLSDRPRSRADLAELLFGDAADPLGALRWALAELRRILGLSEILRGDPVSVGLEDASVDVLQVRAGLFDVALLRDHRAQLLEGVHVSASPMFDAWMMAEQHRVSEQIDAMLRQRAHGLLGTGRPAEAVEFAKQAVDRSPLDEDNHELLIRAIAASGDRRGALRQVASSTALLRAELSVDPSSALREAVDMVADPMLRFASRGRAVVAGQLEAGRAALAAGAVSAGLQRMRQAVLEAARCGDRALQGQALVALGGAVLHAARDRGEDGVPLLREGLSVATQAGDRATCLNAHRELAHAAVKAGRRAEAKSWLSRAEAITESDHELAAILGIQGLNASDYGDYPAAFKSLEESVNYAAQAGDNRQQAWSLSLIARAHLLRGELEQSAAVLGRSLSLVIAERWVAFRPWVQTLQAELDLHAGDVDRAGEQLEQAWVMACQLGDACWEGMAARGIGLLHSQRGEHEHAFRWLMEGATRSRRPANRYQWIQAHVLDSLISESIRGGDLTGVAARVDRLEQLAVRSEMRELSVRASVHRHALGDASALTEARRMAAGIDNPALAALLEGPTDARRLVRFEAAG